jgi:competence protein ComEC
VSLADGRAVAVVQDRRAFAEDCRRAAFVISPLAAPPTCTPPVLLDRAFLAAHGAAAVRVTSAGHEIVTTRRPDEPRAWLQRDGPKPPAVLDSPRPRRTTQRALHPTRMRPSRAFISSGGPG